MDHRQDQRRKNRRDQAQPRRSGHRRNRAGKERRKQHLAFKADVENPRPF